MADNNSIAKYVDYSDAIKRVERNPVFKHLEETLVKTLDYLASRFSVRKHYDYFNEPRNGHDHEMLFKVRNLSEDIMWVYLIHSEKASYISIEIDPESVSRVRNEIQGFDDIILRKTNPRLKLIFRDYDRIEESLVKICDCYDGSVVVSKDDINTPLKPARVFKYTDGTLRCVCGRCGVDFLKSPRCPVCGQKINYEAGKWNKPKIANINEWIEKTVIEGVSTKEVADFVESVCAHDRVSYHIGAVDLTMDIKIKDRETALFMFFGNNDRFAFQPQSLMDALEMEGFSNQIVMDFMENIRPLLSSKQKNKPYDRLRGYYYIDNSAIRSDSVKLTNAIKRLISDTQYSSVLCK